MLKITQISPRGQITIPVWIRQRLALDLDEERQVVVWLRIEAGEIVIKPLVKQNLTELRGSVKPKNRPENWSLVRRKTKKRVAQKLVLN